MKMRLVFILFVVAIAVVALTPSDAAPTAGGTELASALAVVRIG
jgi:hypothetical protein